MKRVLFTTVFLIGASACAMAQNNTGNSGQGNSGYDWATARSVPAVTEGTFGPMSRNTVLQEHLTGVSRGRQCIMETKRMLSKLAKEDYRGAQKTFSPTKRNLVTPDRLAQIWTSLQTTYGQPSKPTKEGVLIDSPAGGYSVIALGMTYPHADLTAHVMCDIHNKLTDFKVTQDQQVTTK
jgi:hypothetical protein